MSNDTPQNMYSSKELYKAEEEEEINVPYTVDRNINELPVERSSLYKCPRTHQRPMKIQSSDGLTKADIACRAGYTITEAPEESKRDHRLTYDFSKSIVFQTNIEDTGSDKIQKRYKLGTQMRRRLKERTPVISGHTLEHYYRYGKPPFLNYGYLRNKRITRY